MGKTFGDYFLSGLGRGEKMGATGAKSAIDSRLKVEEDKDKLANYLGMIKQIKNENPDLINDAASINVGDKGITLGSDPAARQANKNNSQQRHETDSLARLYKQIVQPYVDKASKGLEALENLKNGTATADQVASAFKAAVVHNGGQVPQGLIKVFEGTHGGPGKLQEWVNTLSGDVKPTLTPSQRQALAQVIGQDVDVSQNMVQKGMERIQAQGPTIAPTLNTSGLLKQHMSGFVDPNAEKIADYKKNRNNWIQGDEDVPRPSVANVGQAIHDKIAQVPSALSGFFGGLTGNSPPAQAPQQSPMQNQAPKPQIPQPSQSPPVPQTQSQESPAPKLQPGEIMVKEKRTGRLGAIMKNEFDSNLYDQVQ